MLGTHTLDYVWLCQIDMKKLSDMCCESQFFFYPLYPLSKLMTVSIKYQIWDGHVTIHE